MANKTVNIFNNLLPTEVEILSKLHINIKKDDYSSQEYEFLCMDIIQYYKEIDKLKLLNVSIDEYDIVLEKLYELENLFEYNKEKYINIYNLLNDRDRYILGALYINIENRTLSYFELQQIISFVHNQKKKISSINISRDDFIFAYNEYTMKKSIYNHNLPYYKYNIYNSISNKSKKVMFKLGIPFEDEEIDFNKFSEISQQLSDKLQLIFGTKINEQECDDLIFKLSELL